MCACVCIASCVCVACPRRYFVSAVLHAEFVQEIEVYRSTVGASTPLRVYLLVHVGSADHQRYLSFLKGEKEVICVLEIAHS